MGMVIGIVTNFTYQDIAGGTEIYCKQLANSLSLLGNSVFWFAPNFHETTTCEEGVGVFTIVKFAAKSNKPDVNISDLFIQEAKARSVDILHFHEFGGVEGVNVDMLELCKASGFSVVITYHLLQNICFTGTLKFAGVEPCSGRLVPSKCAVCSRTSPIHVNNKIKGWLARKLADLLRISIKYKIHRFFSGLNQWVNSFQLKLESINKISNYSDAVISLSDWFTQILLINGLKREKIFQFYQVSPNLPSVDSSIDGRSGFVYMGRINYEKGIDLLIKSAEILSAIDDEFYIDIYGPLPHHSSQKYLIDLISKSPNLSYKGFVASENVIDIISKYKAVIVPSRVEEMAPLIIMEANHAKVPVVASDVKGNLEMVTRLNCGLLFRSESVSDLVDSIKLINKNSTDFLFLKPCISDFNELALRHIKLYNSIYKH